jgi:hypothetical protein
MEDCCLIEVNPNIKMAVVAKAEFRSRGLCRSAEEDPSTSRSASCWTLLLVGMDVILGEQLELQAYLVGLSSAYLAHVDEEDFAIVERQKCQ